MKKKAEAQIVPVDLERCQAEMPNPDYGPFRMGGSGQRMVRCTAVPTVIAKDKSGGKMSLCDDCLRVATEQLAVGSFTTKPIER